MKNVNDFFISFLNPPKMKSILEVIPELSTMVGFPQLNNYHIYDVWTHTVMAIQNSNGDRITNIALLFHDIGKPKTMSIIGDSMHFYGHANESIEIAKPILERLIDDESTINEIIELIKYHDINIYELVNKKALKRLYLKLGETQLNRLIELIKADIMAQNPVYMERRLDIIDIIRDNLKDIINQDKNTIKLAINGKDLISIGFKEGPYLGELISKLKDYVRMGVCKNERDSLIDKACLIHQLKNIEIFLQGFNENPTIDSLFEISMYVHENPELLEEFPEFYDVKSDLENYLGVKIGE